MYGAIQSVRNFRLTTFDEVSSGKFNQLIKTNLFVGSVEFMKEIFSKVGLDNVRLPKNSNRDSTLLTLGEVKQRVSNGEKLFIKPYDIKLFTGFVYDGYGYSILDTIDDDTKLIVYQPFSFKILSEWRVYVYRNSIEDWKNYSGSIAILPDYNYVESVIYENKLTFPDTYTIDIGILENGENVVIEYNDMWAIGNYGIDNDVYLKLLQHRYNQIMNTKI
jgi:hypothetical protein